MTNKLTAALSLFGKHKEGMRMARPVFAMTVRRTAALIYLVDSPYGQFIFSEKEAYERAVFGLIVSQAPLYRIAEWANLFDASALGLSESERIHFDTTTVTFHGQYKTSFKESKITHGINKDHRPDLPENFYN